MTDAELVSEASSPLHRAGLMRRLAALLYDGFLVAALWMVLGFGLQLIVGTESNQLVDGIVQTDPLLDAILFTLMVASSSGFYIWFWTKSGQTLGMIAWRIKLESVDGGLIDFKQGVIRYIAAWPAFFLLGLGYLSIYLDSNGDAAHDKVSRSKVVVLPKSHRPFD
ncbi:MAG: RDD family protein [Gammaproteobacteria bacterium]|nr:RDD family protein [Gammaproteobacteria bacterium]MBL4728477.1 RDD family protein [Gammaproteobacteria bacterium]